MPGPILNRFGEPDKRYTKQNKRWVEMGPMYYDRQGKPIWDTLTWGRKLEDWEYKRVDQTKLWWGGWLSTVWLGLDHGMRLSDQKNYRPLIFESMLFYRDWSELDMNRYYTEQGALDGHHAMLLEWSGGWKILKVWFNYWVLYKTRIYKLLRLNTWDLY